MLVGRYPVVVRLNGQNSSVPVFLDRLCTAGQFGLPGSFCKPCPKVRKPDPISNRFRTISPHPTPLDRVYPPIHLQNADCVSLFPAPLPHPGYYPVSLTDFVACIPASACPGIDAAGVQIHDDLLEMRDEESTDEVVLLCIVW